MKGRQQTNGGAPVFVYGALRSGTTVFRLMLASHPRLRNPGEVDFLLDYLVEDSSRACGWRYRMHELQEDRIFQASGLKRSNGKDGLALLHDFLDQLRGDGDQVLTLNIHRNVSRLGKLLPDAHVIHMLRDPRDVARSCIGMGWAGTLYHGVGQWISCEREWDHACHMFNPEQHMSLRYEDLIRNPKHELCRVCQFVGVDFDNGMLNYNNNTTYGAPDPSLIEQWKQKSSDSEVSLVEGRTKDLMQSRGYELATVPRVPSAFERIKLNALNRILIWRRAVRRYGVRLFLLEKLTRRLGLKGIHDRCSARMRERNTALLK